MILILENMKLLWTPQAANGQLVVQCTARRDDDNGDDNRYDIQLLDGAGCNHEPFDEPGERASMVPSRTCSKAQRFSRLHRPSSIGMKRGAAPPQMARRGRWRA